MSSIREAREHVKRAMKALDEGHPTEEALRHTLAAITAALDVLDGVDNRAPRLLGGALGGDVGGAPLPLPIHKGTPLAGGAQPYDVPLPLDHTLPAQAPSVRAGRMSTLNM